MKVKTVEDVLTAVDASALLMRPLSEWRPILAEECQVYVFEENYLAKRFDQINFKFCEKNEAKEILVDNLYALLRYKYFPTTSEEIDERIAKIVASFTMNLKTTLLRVSFDQFSDAIKVNMLPDYCIAFRNGVYNFRKNDWEFKYNIIELGRLSNKLYLYDRSKIIFWYFNYNFEPLPIDINSTSLEEFVEIMKEITKTNRNYCFELMYNIAHDISDKFDISRFSHLCQVLGYTSLQSFSQHFVMLIGSGQNGKNSLFDGCFTSKVIPRPSANDLDSIETDRFITGSLENKCQNLFLETSAKTYTESKMIKALTGSMYQTIEQKGVSKYSGMINCKYIFAGNDQDNIKFSDMTRGFTRRINVFETYYQWDPKKKFLKRGDYYDTTFSDSLSELKDDVSNTTAFIYFAMYGIMQATKNFTRNFEFTKNDWNQKYSAIDVELKDRVNHISLSKISTFLAASTFDAKQSFFDMDRRRLYMSPTLAAYSVKSYADMLNFFNNAEQSAQYFADNDIYISLQFIQAIIHDISTKTIFTQSFKKTFGIQSYVMLSTNKPFVKCSFNGGMIRILR